MRKATVLLLALVTLTVPPLLRPASISKQLL
ncbi:hypothetical protein NECAME_11762 [Necator americanus]|uniref:Uncharacterized protein n=1 Tax=Necator americanus TaxID=51031 RepID=W2T420_NECAM|nr:hypothetical protein NECAME_11762 [Necator americanus]ETN76284.1 hypothetical protein NECAME_11762 [Necator americanus]